MEETTFLNLWVMSAEYGPYISGGLGTVATNLTEELAKMDVRITVITMTPSASVSSIRNGNITVVRFPKHCSTSTMAQYMSSISFHLPDAIHIHSLEYVPLLKYYKKVARIPTVYTCHSLVLKSGLSRVFTPRRQAQLLRSVDRIIVPSDSEYIKLMQKYPNCAGKSTVIGHGVKGTENKSADISVYRLLYAGRLVHGKGLEQLIDAMAVLKDKYPEAQLFVIGTGRASYRRELKMRAIRKRVSNIVHWLGRYSHGRLQAAYLRFGAVVMPSRAESFGLVALEVLANGVPLVATQAGGLRQFVTSEVAQVIPRVDGASIAKAVTTMWQSPGMTTKRVAAGRQLAQNYRWSYVARRCTEVYEEIVNDGGLVI